MKVAIYLAFHDTERIEGTPFYESSLLACARPWGAARTTRSSKDQSFEGLEGFEAGVMIVEDVGLPTHLTAWDVRIHLGVWTQVLSI